MRSTSRGMLVVRGTFFPALVLSKALFFSSTMSLTEKRFCALRLHFSPLAVLFFLFPVALEPCFVGGLATELVFAACSMP